MMTRSRRSLYLTFSGLAVLVLTLAVTTCSGGSGSGSSSGAPTSPSSSGSAAANAGMVAGTGTCQYSATPTSFDVALPGQGGDSFGVPQNCIGSNTPCLFEIPVTVTGVAANGERCTWWAEVATISNDWIDIEGAMTGNGLIPANGGGVVIVAANGTVQFSLADEEQPLGLAIDCKTFDATDYIMTPQTASFDYAGGAGQGITVEVAPPKTREGSILIREQGSNILLFTIPVTQHGSVCSWYLHAINCDGSGACSIADPPPMTPESDWISVDGGMPEGSGTLGFSVSAGDVPAGNPAPRNGAILLLDESIDKQVGITYINQLGEPAEDNPECSYNYAISQTEFFGYVEGTAQLTVTASSSTCGWHAEASAASESWISVDSTNAPCPGGVCYGTQTVQVVVQQGDVGSPPITGPAGRSGAVIIDRVGGTFEQLFTIPITQFRQYPE